MLPFSTVTQGSGTTGGATDNPSSSSGRSDLRTAGDGRADAGSASGNNNLDQSFLSVGGGASGDEAGLEVDGGAGRREGFPTAMTAPATPSSGTSSDSGVRGGSGLPFLTPRGGSGAGSGHLLTFRAGSSHAGARASSHDQAYDPASPANGRSSVEPTPRSAGYNVLKHTNFMTYEREVGQALFCEVPATPTSVSDHVDHDHEDTWASPLKEPPPHSLSRRASSVPEDDHADGHHRGDRAGRDPSAASSTASRLAFGIGFAGAFFGGGGSHKKRNTYHPATRHDRKVNGDQYEAYGLVTTSSTSGSLESSPVAVRPTAYGAGGTTTDSRATVEAGLPGSSAVLPESNSPKGGRRKNPCGESGKSSTDASATLTSQATCGASWQGGPVVHVEGVSSSQEDSFCSGVLDPKTGTMKNKEKKKTTIDPFIPLINEGVKGSRGKSDGRNRYHSAPGVQRNVVHGFVHYEAEATGEEGDGEASTRERGTTTGPTTGGKSSSTFGRPGVATWARMSDELDKLPVGGADTAALREQQKHFDHIVQGRHLSPTSGEKEKGGSTGGNRTTEWKERPSAGEHPALSAEDTIVSDGASQQSQWSRATLSLLARTTGATTGDSMSGGMARVGVGGVARDSKESVGGYSPTPAGALGFVACRAEQADEDDVPSGLGRPLTVSTREHRYNYHFRIELSRIRNKTHVASSRRSSS